MKKVISHQEKTVGSWQLAVEKTYK